MRCGAPLAVEAWRTHRRHVLNGRIDGVRDAIWCFGGWVTGRAGSRGRGRDGVGFEELSSTDAQVHES